MEQRILILYHSQTGFTARYAHWLAEELNAPCHPFADYKKGMEAAYDTILCGGPIFASELSGIKKYRKLQKANPDKRFFYFATGLRPPSAAVEDALRRYNFGDDSRQALFYFQGGLAMEQLSQKHKTLLTALRAMLGRKRDATEEDKKLLTLLRASGDYSDRAQLQPLLEALKS